jgi:hypothetical protein
MRGEVMGPQVRLDFHDPADAFHAARHVNQVLPEQFPRDNDRVAIIKRTGQFSHQSFPDGSSKASRLYVHQGFLNTIDSESFFQVFYGMRQAPSDNMGGRFQSIAGL